MFIDEHPQGKHATNSLKTQRQEKLSLKPLEYYQSPKQMGLFEVYNSTNLDSSDKRGDHHSFWETQNLRTMSDKSPGFSKGFRKQQNL